MYKLLIVDDESFVRMSIKNIINWEEHGFYTPYEANNGREALQCLEQEEIDIILTDIKMPEMSGLELLEEIKKKDYDVEVVILSCYNDFEYVRKAMQLGACDYIFKPTMFPEDILKIAKEAKSKIEKKQKTRKIITNLKDKVRLNSFKAKESYLTELLYGKKVNKEEFNYRMKELEVKFKSDEFVVMIIHLDNYFHMLINEFEHDEYLLKMAILNVLRELFEQYSSIELLSRSVQEYILVISDFENNGKSFSATEEINKEKSKNKISKIMEEFSKYLGKVTIGISTKKHHIQDIHLAYIEASTALDNLLNKQHSKLPANAGFYEELTLSRDIEHPSKHKISKLINEFYHIKEEEYKAKINEIMDQSSLDPSLNINDIYEICSHIISIIMRKVNNYEEIIDKIYENDEGIYEKLFKLKDINDIRLYLESIVDDMESFLHNKLTLEVYRALRYIEDHYDQPDISLHSVAEHVNMSKNYFSKLFKDSYGENFINYLIDYRLQKAEEFFINTNLKVYEIAEKVGYSDWRYFSKLYKKRKGRNITSLKK